MRGQHQFCPIRAKTYGYCTRFTNDWPWVGARRDVAELRDRVEPDPGVVERDEADVVVPDDLLGQDLGMTFYASDNLTSLTFIEVILDKLTHLNMSSVLTAEFFES